MLQCGISTFIHVEFHIENPQNFRDDTFSLY